MPPPSLELDEPAAVPSPVLDGSGSLVDSSGPVDDGLVVSAAPPVEDASTPVDDELGGSAKHPVRDEQPSSATHKRRCIVIA
jgi:hypothetical protein